MSAHNFHLVPGTNIQILAPQEDLDFFDLQSTQLHEPMTPLQAWSTIMSEPMPLLKFAFKVRDGVSSLFNVKRIGGFSHKQVTEVKVGEKLDFFLVESLSKDVLTLTARDTHLDVATCISVMDKELSITSSVQTHNLFGKAYMVPVAPAHRVIVSKMLKRLAKV